MSGYLPSELEICRVLARVCEGLAFMHDDAKPPRAHLECAPLLSCWGKAAQTKSGCFCANIRPVCQAVHVRLACCWSPAQAGWLAL